MAYIWTVKGGEMQGRYLQLFRGGVLYPLRDELADEMTSRASFRDVDPPEAVPEFKSATEIKVKETEGEGPELIMNPARDGSIRYSIRLSKNGESFFISPYLAYGLKHTNRLELEEVGRMYTKKEAGKAMVYRLLPTGPSCAEGEGSRICYYRT